MQSSLRNYDLYDFNRQKVFRARYIVKNLLASQEY